MSRLVDNRDFKGDRYEVAVLYPAKGHKRVLLIGLGKPEDIVRGSIRRAAATAARKAVGFAAEALAFYVAHESRGGVPPAVGGQGATEGAAPGGCQVRELKARDDRRGRLKAFQL